MIDVARQSYERAGLAGRATFLQANTRRVRLPVLADIAICDHVGYFGLDYGVADLLADARHHCLKPDGLIVPSALRLHACLVSSETCRQKANAWSGAGIPPAYHWVREKAVNTRHGVRLTPTEILSDGPSIASIDLYQDLPEFLSWSTELRVTCDGRLDGLAGWFEAQLAPGVWMTNSPLSPNAINRPQAFLPIETPIPVKVGDTVKATIMTRPSEHLIAWVVEHRESGKRFQHSTWKGRTLSPSDLAKGDTTRVPRLSPVGAARLSVLRLCDGHRSAKEIEAAVLAEHPDLFPSTSEISAFVAEVLGRDSE